MSEKKKVLFICTGNSCRSQMAEGYLRSLAGDLYEVSSAGLEPKAIHPLTLEVMKEDGVDISGQESKDILPFLGQYFDYVITVCDNANEKCPNFPGRTKRLHWSFQDPVQFKGSQEEKKKIFIIVRDQIKEQIKRFLQTF